jgi:hypothetical protein
MADWFETRFRELTPSDGMDPAFPARMRALVLDEWRADHIDTDRHLDTETADDDPGEIIVLETEDRPSLDDGPGPSGPRWPGRWFLVAAALAVVALVGALLVDSDDADVDTAADVPGAGPAEEGPAQPVPQVEEFLPLDPGRWYVDPDGDDATPLRVSFDVAAPGWKSWLGTVDFSGRSHVVLTVTTITNLVADGCTDHTPLDPPVGPSVDDLATALTQLQPFEVSSAPTDVTVLGYEGTHVQLTVPDLPISTDRGEVRFADCTGGTLKSWYSPLHDGGRNPYFGYNGEPGRTEDFWIIDVEGTRLVLTTSWGPGSLPEDVAELDAIVDSIRIEP